jgi:hypothetical protein
MMFVPSIGGISHHWTENTSDEDIVLGAQVFTDAIVNALADRPRPSERPCGQLPCQQDFGARTL